MKCPACGNTMEVIAVADIKVDVCRHGCGGAWFDRFEIQKVDEAHESAGAMLLEIERDESVKVDQSKKRKCPRCENVTMMRHFFSIKKEIVIDECPGCAGMWLDYGELEKIRSQFATEEAREQAAEDYFSKIFDGELAKTRKKSKDALERAKKVASLFRFICPSYYIPGKQSWGAF
jgi:Zn-finger nucleic acid-binding protein